MGDKLFFETEQTLQAASLTGILRQPHLLQAQLLNLLFQLAVLSPQTPQVKIVVPDIADAFLGGDEGFFKRADGGDSPDPDQAAGIGVGRALDLYRQANYFGKQHDHQDGDVAVTGEEVFHFKSSSQWSVVSGQLSIPSTQFLGTGGRVCNC